MSGGPLSRKSALKKPMTRRLRRGMGSRELIDINGRAVMKHAPNTSSRTLMFANSAKVRPFNFRNPAAETANASLNRMTALVEGKNARGNPPIIHRNDPRANPKFAEALGTNLAALGASMAKNRVNRAAGINQPTLNQVRISGLNQYRPYAKERRLMVAQYDMGQSVDEINYLREQGANNAYIEEELDELERPFRKQMAMNNLAAHYAAYKNAKEAGYNSRRKSRRKTRRKTRRNRK